MSPRGHTGPPRSAVERVMQHYITYHLERSVRSSAFLRQLKRNGTASK